eukprot:6209706-Pleurochrysis_carterae.AAC.2
MLASIRLHEDERGVALPQAPPGLPDPREIAASWLRHACGLLASLACLPWNHEMLLQQGTLVWAWPWGHLRLLKSTCRKPRPLPARREMRGARDRSVPLQNEAASAWQQPSLQGWQLLVLQALTTEGAREEHCACLFAALSMLLVRRDRAQEAPHACSWQADNGGCHTK